MTENSWFCVGLLKMASTTEHRNAVYEELALLIHLHYLSNLNWKWGILITKFCTTFQ